MSSIAYLYFVNLKICNQNSLLFELVIRPAPTNVTTFGDFVLNFPSL